MKHNSVKIKYFFIILIESGNVLYIYVRETFIEFIKIKD